MPQARSVSFLKYERLLFHCDWVINFLVNSNPLSALNNNSLTTASFTLIWVWAWDLCQSTSLSWHKAPIWGLQPDFITVRQLQVCWCGVLSLRRGRVCRLELLLVLASAVIFKSESPGVHDHILLSQIWDFPFRSHLVMDAWLRLHYCSFQASCHNMYSESDGAKWIRWGLSVNTCIYCVLFTICLIIFYYIGYLFYCFGDVLLYVYCIGYVLLYCAVYFLLYYVRTILSLRFIVLCYLRFIVLCCTTV
jgi:hypothetical protein